MKKFMQIGIVLLSLIWVFGLYMSMATKTENTENTVILEEKPTEELFGEVLVGEKVATTTIPEVMEKKSSLSVDKKVEIVIPFVPPKIILPEPNFEPINAYVRKATVNIFCTTSNSSLSPVSGTGIIISENGLILTNAHVAQYFLLKDLYQKDYISCVARTGSPAYPRYNLELVYISPVWIETNSSGIKSQNPTGTGENDYAFLRVVSEIDNSDLQNFSYVPVNLREDLDVGEPVILVSYPAGFLGGLSIIQGLSQASAITKIQDVFTFKDGMVDVISVGGTVVSQKGASGGAVVDRNTSLIGIISTSSSGDTTSSRNLNAITLSYINKSFLVESGISIKDLLLTDLSIFAKNFQENTAPGLTKILTDEIVTR